MSPARSTSTNLPIGNDLFQALKGAWRPTEDDPLLLAKVTLAEGQVVYPINLDVDGSITYFDPKELGAFVVVSQTTFRGAQQCPVFRPTRLSTFDPAWFRASSEMDPDDWPC